LLTIIAMTAAVAIWDEPPFAGVQVTDQIKQAVLNAYRTLMRPSVQTLVRNGVSFGEFTEVLKVVFVDAAAELLALEDSKQSLTRVAITTGVPRLDVARILETGDIDLDAVASKVGRVGRLLTGWHQDPEFIGPYGIPYELPFVADRGRRSFTELVRRYAGDIPPEEMIEELKRINAVLELGNSYYRVLYRSYIPATLDPVKFELMSMALTDLARTLDHNLQPGEVEKLLERRVWAPNGVTPTVAAQFSGIVREKGTSFLEALDDWLSERENEVVLDESEPRIRIGLAMYMFVRPESTDGDEPPH
jgi:Family of unknown function (DUF6502)